jgi:hypothetical protein
MRNPDRWRLVPPKTHPTRLEMGDARPKKLKKIKRMKLR